MHFCLSYLLPLLNGFTLTVFARISPTLWFRTKLRKLDLIFNAYDDRVTRVLPWIARDESPWSIRAVIATNWSDNRPLTSSLFVIWIISREREKMSLQRLLFFREVANLCRERMNTISMQLHAIPKILQAMIKNYCSIEKLESLFSNTHSQNPIGIKVSKLSNQIA